MFSQLSGVVLWDGCVQVLVQLAVSAHRLSTKPAVYIQNVFNHSSLHTVLQEQSSTEIHIQNNTNNRLKSQSFHIIHLAYNYNYLYINKRLSEATL